MRMIRSLELARRSKASFKTHAALVESLAQSDETLVVTQWCPARYGVATPISITGFWLIATIAVPITKPTCALSDSLVSFDWDTVSISASWGRFLAGQNVCERVKELRSDRLRCL